MTESHSVLHINLCSLLLYYSLRVITDGKAGTASRLSVDSRTSCSQIIQTASKCHHVAVHMVTQSFPSPIISCVESLPQGAHLSQIIAADSENEHSKSYDVPTTSKFLRDIHIVRTNELHPFSFVFLFLFNSLLSIFCRTFYHLVKHFVPL